MRVAAEARRERECMKALRRRVTFARRRVRQIGEELAALDQVPVQWRRLESKVAELVAIARRCERSEGMAMAVESLERLKTEAEQWLRGAQKAVETSPTLYLQTYP